PNARMLPGLKLVATARHQRTLIVAPRASAAHGEAIARGCELLPCEMHEGRVALPELLEDLAARGIVSLLVEGGAGVARSFLEEGLVDALELFVSPVTLAPEGAAIRSPVTPDTVPDGFRLTGTWQFGEDRLHSYRREV
ncbi:MAG: dihydrofolate reductase family protein, partial [Rhizobiaceae bacterium]